MLSSMVSLLRIIKMAARLNLCVLSVSKDFLAQAGDPTATGTGGEAIWSYIASQNPDGIRAPRYFEPDVSETEMDGITVNARGADFDMCLSVEKSAAPGQTRSSPLIHTSLDMHGKDGMKKRSPKRSSLKLPNL